MEAGEAKVGGGKPQQTSCACDEDFMKQVKLLIVRKNTSVIENAKQQLVEMNSHYCEKEGFSDYEAQKKKLLEIEVAQDYLRKKMAELQDTQASDFQ